MSALATVVGATFFMVRRGATDERQDVDCLRRRKTTIISSITRCHLKQRAQHFYLLDILRGLASLSVVIWHYQHFFFVAPFTLGAPFDRSAQPFYNGLSLFYNEGARAVYLFFVLSGFIFFFQYAESVRTRVTDARRFFVLRFSRLYPLHAATLIFVAIGQTVSLHLSNQTIVYECNNWLRFFVSALFLSDWLPERRICVAFNGPAWSLSVEVFLYILFFVFARAMPNSWFAQVVAVGATILAGLISQLLGGYHLLNEPMYCFFVGGLVYLMWSKVRDGLLPQMAVAVSASTMCTLSIFFMQQHGINEFILDLVVYPSSLLLLVTIQNFQPQSGRRLRLVGDISYSTYLLHFPVQLALLLAVRTGLLKIDFNSRSAWLFFFALVIGISICSFYLYERPAQRYIRRSFLSTEGRRLRHNSSETQINLLPHELSEARYDR
jgi:peptidoglycan/LPS O-acetylase OafA/YrhL